jgi:dTDP-4-amino-4,6-dideoxygalactose transaminase
MSVDATAKKSQESPRLRVPFNDLGIQWREIREDAVREIDQVFEKSAFCLGPHVEAFEREIADWLGVRHAIGVNSGTSALHLSTVAAGIGVGDEVLVPAHTFIATAWGAIYAGALPVLCDVDRASGTIDVSDAAKRVTTRTKAIVAVHLYGQPADMDAVSAFAAKHGLVVIEDAAQSIGARWNGAHTGTIGQHGCISFYPGKNLGAAGEAGLIVTNDDHDAHKMRALRNHGQSERYVHDEIGYNYRLDGLQAAVLRHKLKRLNNWTAQRKALASGYADGLAGLPLELPRIVNQDHVWHLYVVRTPKRDALREYLQNRNIDTGLHYPVPLNRQPCLKNFVGSQESYPESDRWADQALSLPLFVGMTAEQLAHVVASVSEFFAHG